MTTEQRLRAAERSGDETRLLVERLRAGQITRAAVRAAAYLGDVAARSALGGPAECGAIHFIGERCGDLKSSSSWLTGLTRLFAALPVESGVPCGDCQGNRWTWRGFAGDLRETPVPCHDCNGTGRRKVTTPGERLWSVRAACAVARAVTCCGRMHCAAGLLRCNAREAVVAAEAWCVEPTEERHRAWLAACDYVFVVSIHWLPLPPGAPGWEELNAGAIQHAATLIGEAAVREALRTLVPLLLGETS